MPQALVDHRVALGPVRDQGNRETCLSHATSTAHEKCRNLLRPLSPEYLHFFASGGQPGGCTVDEMVGALENYGQPAENDCPYSLTDPAPEWRPAKSLEVFKRLSDQGSMGLPEVERLIQSGQIPVLIISLPREFFNPAPPWIIPTGVDAHGLHAVAGVGVGAHGTDKVILIRNSWGDSWADEGHAWLDQDFITQRLHDVLVLTEEVTQ